MTEATKCIVKGLILGLCCGGVRPSGQVTPWAYQDGTVLTIVRAYETTQTDDTLEVT